MMKIILATPQNTSGGAERVITALANEFSRGKNDVIYVNFDRESSFYPFLPSVKTVKMDIGFDGKKTRLKRLLAPTVEVKRYLAIKKLLKKERPDAVIAFLKTAEILFGLASRRLRIPFITSIRNDLNAYSGILVKFRKRMYPRFKAIVCQTAGVKEQLDRSIRCNSVVIPNPIDPNAISATTHIGGPRAQKVIAVGRLNKQKNFRLFIDSVHALLESDSQYSNYEYLIFGEGEQREELQDLIKNYGLTDRIKLCGAVKNAISCHADAALFVMSSDYEGFPNALAEAMANGIPVISTDFSSGAAKELIGENERGLLVDVNNKDQLVNAIRESLSNQDDAEKRAQVGMSFVEQYKLSSIGRRWLSLIEQ